MVKETPFWNFELNFLSCFWFGFIVGGHVGPLRWVLWLAAVCLEISVWMSWDLQWDCGPVLGSYYGILFAMSWAEPESEPQLKMCCLCEVCHDLGTFLSHINETYTCDQKRNFFYSQKEVDRVSRTWHMTINNINNMCLQVLFVTLNSVFNNCICVMESIF